MVIMKKKKYLQTVNPGEDVEKKEHSYTTGESLHWYSHYWEQYVGSLKT